MTKNLLTFHSLTPLPWHNLNRDDQGLPKSFQQGGGARGQLSSASLKRAARLQYEIAASQFGRMPSTRSREIADLAVKRAEQLAATRGVTLDVAKATQRAKTTLRQLTANAKKDENKKKAAKKVTETEATESVENTSDVVIWLSSEEIDGLAEMLVAEAQDDKPSSFLREKQTTNLAIAAFGRMFAYAPEMQNEAAIAVSNASTTHPISVEIDYFTAVDDLVNQGAAHLNQAFYVTGVYYRSFTIDRKQLRDTWLSWDTPDADERLKDLLRAVILALPQGRKNSTAAAVRPAVIIAEEQAHRVSYSFETPVEATVEGGFLTPSVNKLVDMMQHARAFDPSVFGSTVLSGEYPELAATLETPPVNLDGLLDFAVGWLRS